MKSNAPQTIELHVLAPHKPAYGLGCNGCGVCCAAKPCPVALVFLLQWRGRCRALLWQEEARRYVCGMVVCPDRYIYFLPARWRARFGSWAVTRIAAGSGCDSTLEVEE